MPLLPSKTITSQAPSSATHDGDTATLPRLLCPAHVTFLAPEYLGLGLGVAYPTTINNVEKRIASAASASTSGQLSRRTLDEGDYVCMKGSALAILGIEIQGTAAWKPATTGTTQLLGHCAFEGVSPRMFGLGEPVSA